MKKLYLDYLKAKGYARGTIIYKKIYLDEFLSYLDLKGIPEIKEVNSNIIEDYKKYIFRYKCKRTKEKLNVRTIFAKLFVVKQYFKFLEKHKYILLNPCKNLTIPKTPDYLPKNILNEEETKELLEKPDLNTKVGIRDRAILELLYSTGIRRQELINLNIYDLDLENNEIRINKGKNRKDRIVPIGEIASIYLEKYIREARKYWIKSSLDQALFISYTSERLTTGGLNYTLRKYILKFYPNKKISCHSFRHACAIHMLKGGANIRVIQELLGHKSMSATQIYTKISPIDLKEAYIKYHPHAKEKKAV